jgi:hypothetical protein
MEDNMQDRPYRHHTEILFEIEEWRGLFHSRFERSNSHNYDLPGSMKCL